MPLSDVKSSSIPMMATEVAQAGTISKIHISVAKAKMAMMRCWTTFKPSMPNAVLGRFHKTRVTAKTKKAS